MQLESVLYVFVSEQANGQHCGIRICAPFQFERMEISHYALHSVLSCTHSFAGSPAYTKLQARGFNHGQRRATVLLPLARGCTRVKRRQGRSILGVRSADRRAIRLATSCAFSCTGRAAVGFDSPKCASPDAWFARIVNPRHTDASVRRRHHLKSRATARWLLCSRHIPDCGQTNPT